MTQSLLKTELSCLLSPVAKNSRSHSKHRIQHLLGQFSGKCILLAGVVAADEGEGIIKLIADAVTEAGPRPVFRPFQFADAVEDGIKSQFAKADNYTELVQELKFAQHIRAAI